MDTSDQTRTAYQPCAEQRMPLRPWADGLGCGERIAARGSSWISFSADAVLRAMQQAICSPTVLHAAAWHGMPVHSAKELPTPTLTRS
ncbi:hypothetical protein CupriaWKF_25525 [Cupriavidus sp. WKF15]|uniref:hypothetical protein n=1 Tax=Cupriavidus sp. WKF15 TaxID=3032282 RepID=UPI0023E22F8C|nr:hypothetical protein [Cupriavidus sp. WKF15]WER48165.1 hypothetical protein CupriaWKF_25525 [Cupriavidus sp. WKF15]